MNLASPPDPRRRPRRRAARAVVALLLAVAALEVVYLLVANIALAAMSSRYAHEAPIAVAYDRAYTLVPGQVRVRGLRVTGDGWKLAASDAAVDFNPFAVVTAPRRIHHVGADVTSIELASKDATRRLSGTIRIDLANVILDGPHVALDASAKVERGRIESDGEAVAGDVAGTLTVVLDSKDVVTRPIIGDTSGAIDWSGTLLSIEPLASLASLGATADPGTLRIAGSWKSGVVQPSSELRAQTGNASVNAARGVSVRFPSGVAVVVSVAPTDARALQLAVRAPRVVVGSADPSEPPDELTSFALVAPAGASGLAAESPPTRSLDWSAERVLLHEGATTFTSTATGSLRFESKHDTGLVADSGSIIASNVVADRADTTGRTPFEARLALTRLTISPRDGLALAGRLHASGADPRPVLELFVSSPSIRGQLGPLERHAFTADATLTRKDEQVSLDDLVLRCAKVVVRGGYRRQGRQSRSAFVVEGGPVPVGIAQHGAKESIVLGPGSSWVASQLAVSGSR